MKRFFVFFTAIIVLISVQLADEPSLAAAPWSWKMTLDGKESGLSMNMPAALYVDEEKSRYYVVDSGRNRLLSYNQEGKLLHAFSVEGQLQVPFDMVRDEEGLLWVIEKGRNSLTSINIAKKEIVTHDLSDGKNMLVPQRLEYRDGFFYVLDKISGDVVVLNKGLEVEKRFSCSDCLGGFVDFKLEKNSLWALDLQGREVVLFSENGTVTKRFSVGEQVKYPVSLAVGPSGFLYVVDRHEGFIAVYDAEGNYKYTFLGWGQSRGQLYYPIEILFDPWGRLCVVEEGNGRVEIFGR